MRNPQFCYALKPWQWGILKWWKFVFLFFLLFFSQQFHQKSNKNQHLGQNILRISKRYCKRRDGTHPTLSSRGRKKHQAIWDLFFQKLKTERTFLLPELEYILALKYNPPIREHLDEGKCQCCRLWTPFPWNDKSSSLSFWSKCSGFIKQVGGGSPNCFSSNK